MDVIRPDIIAVDIYNVCLQMQKDPTAIPDWQDIALLLGTAAVESGFSLERDAMRKRVTFGIFGLGIDQAYELYEQFRIHEPFFIFKYFGKAKDEHRQQCVRWHIFTKSWLGINGVPYFDLDKKDLRYLMVHDIKFAASMCRWYYLNNMQSDPETVADLAEIWATLYNSDPQRNDEDFLNAWEEHECRTLMALLGYQ